MTEATQQSEPIRQAVAAFIGRPLNDDEFANFATSWPALYYLIEGRTAGRLPDGKNITDKFIRALPEDLFDHLLVPALGVFRRASTMDIQELLSGEFCAVAIWLYLFESRRKDCYGTNEEATLICQRLAALLLLEEQRRAGAFAWINHYSLLARVTEDYPPRLPVVDRRTEH